MESEYTTKLKEYVVAEVVWQMWWQRLWMFRSVDCWMEGQ